MNTKKIIIILISVILILALSLWALNRSRPQPEDDGTTLIPTGIVRPTESVVAGELDIVNVNIDNDEDVSLNQIIEIEFSKNFNMNEIEFLINPNTPHDINIEDNKLIVNPVDQWEAGTLYNYTINFPDDPQKVRLYTFTTSGPTKKYLPDTQPEGLVEDTLQQQKTNDPDVYVANNTPYESNTFSVRADFESSTPAHFYFTVTPKVGDEDEVRQAVRVWLQQLDLSDAQIDSLDIRYE